MVRANSELPRELLLTCRRLGVVPTGFLLTISVRAQKMSLWERSRLRASVLECVPTQCVGALSNHRPAYFPRKEFLISTSRYGIGQTENSNQTPLGLHRIARKVGGGYPIGTVFRSRTAAGLTWDGLPKAAIVHRILWLEGLEPGFNKGGNVDSFRRYIYIHGCGDETTLGRPQSRGCIHLAARDLIPLYDRLPTGTLVWISQDHF